MSWVHTVSSEMKAKVNVRAMVLACCLLSNAVTFYQKCFLIWDCNLKCVIGKTYTHRKERKVKKKIVPVSTYFCSSAIQNLPHLPENVHRSFTLCVLYISFSRNHMQKKKKKKKKNQRLKHHGHNNKAKQVFTKRAPTTKYMFYLLWFYNSKKLQYIPFFRHIIVLS